MSLAKLLAALRRLFAPKSPPQPALPAPPPVIVAYDDTTLRFWMGLP